MRSIDANALDWQAPPAHHREGNIAFKRLFDGTPGSPDNYSFTLVRIEGGYFTPRHRHNYDQLRWCLSGSIDYGQGRAVRAGQVGYFPEGTYYGPQDITAQDAVVLQCGGASGQGFLTGAELREGRARLETKGRFEGGVFVREAAEGRRNQDGFEAVWEEMSGRPLVYPPARFAEPVVMTPDAFDWRQVSEGVAHKHLATFGERRIGLDMWRVEAPARLALPAAPSLRLIYMLSGPSAGRAHALEAHEDIALEAGTSGELMVITLPPVAG